MKFFNSTLLILQVLLFSLFATVSADDLANDYRLKGEAFVIEKLEAKLQSKAYWNQFLADKIIDYGYTERVIDLLVCEKAQKTMALMHQTHETIKIDTVLPVITGEKDGPKHREGDLKTPTGTYQLIKQKNNVDAFYGPLALITSYPNMYDNLKGKTGHGIWIHGKPLDNADRDEYTKGCIVLDNESLTYLSSQIDYKNTVLMISEDSLLKTNREEIATIFANIYKWRDAWKKSDFKAYMAFYADNFIRFDGKNLRQFKDMKRTIFRKGGQKIILFDNFEIMLYPTITQQRVFVITFTEDYRAKGVVFEGKKELYVSLEGKQMKILAEK